MQSSSSQKSRAIEHESCVHVSSVLSALYHVECNTAFHVAGKTQASPLALDKE